MVKAILFMFVFFGPADQREPQMRYQDMSNPEACWEAAIPLTKIKPPADGAIIVGCEIQDLGPTK